MIYDNIRNLIDKRVDTIEENKRKKAEEEKAKLDAAFQRCVALVDRIRNVIETANYIQDRGIRLPGTDFKLGKYGYSGSIAAEGFYHYVGFMGHGRVKPITAVGIYNGGACGPYDFYATSWIDQQGEEAGKEKSEYEFEFYLIHENDKEKCHIPVKDARMYEKFAEQFPKFEQAFYAWIKDGMPRAQ